MELDDMVSKLAQQQIEEWWSQGLKPTVEDIVKLNELGLKVENGEEMFSFSRCPRVCWLGDTIVREPTVAKRLYIDQAMRYFADTLDAKVFVVVWALATPDSELPALEDMKKIEKAVTDFRDRVLIKFTDTQIVSVVDWCLNGSKPDYDSMDDGKKREVDEVFDVPAETHSVAKQILLEALGAGIPAEAARYAMLEDLEKMVVVATMSSGSDVIKNQHTKAAAKFYMLAGKIKIRMLAELEAKKEEKNG